MNNVLSKIQLEFPTLKLVLAIQLFLIVLVFHKIVFSPTEYAFSNSYDGLKNYFTYYSFLDHDTGDLMAYESMNYPYGEYVFYTDNTPLISVPMRIVTRIFGNGPYTFAIFNYLVLLSLLLSTFFLYKILKEFLTVPWLIFGLAICLPWINPQINRMAGHMNLSFSWILLAIFYGLILLRKHFPDRKKTAFYSAMLVLTIMAGAFCHLYFLMITAFLVGGFCFFWGLSNFHQKAQIPKIWLLGVAIPLLACAIVYGIILWVDLSYADRGAAGGYDWILYNLNFDALYTAYPWQNIPFLVGTSQPIHFESWSYLGGFALYGAVVFLVLIFFIKRNRSKTSADRKRLVRILFFSGMLGLAISIGEYAYMFDAKLSFDNWANPFYFLSMFTDRFQQFRCLARFNWSFFWGLNFLIAFFVDRYYRASNGKGLAEYLMVGLLIVLCVDTADRLNQQMSIAVKNPFTDAEMLADVRALAKDINAEDYQAILPIPFYHVGSENMEFTIDPNSQWAGATFQLSLETGLPLIASQMSRTALPQAKEIYSILSEDGPSENIRKLLSDKPVLVFYSANPKDHSKTLDHSLYLKLKEWEKNEVGAAKDFQLFKVKL